MIQSASFGAPGRHYQHDVGLPAPTVNETLSLRVGVTPNDQQRPSLPAKPTQARQGGGRQAAACPCPPFTDGVSSSSKMSQQASLPERMLMQSQNTHRSQLDPGLGGVPFFGPNGRVAEPMGPPPVPAQGRPAMNIPMQPSTVKLPGSVQQKIRMCAGVNCNSVFPAQYPHLRCRRCRVNNVPRRPEFRGILTDAQLATQKHFTGSNANAPSVLSYPTSRPLLHEPIPPSVPSVPSIPSALLLPSHPLVPERVLAGRDADHPIKIEPDTIPLFSIDALLADEATEISGDTRGDEGIDDDFGVLELSYPETEGETDVPTVVEDDTVAKPLSITIIDSTAQEKFSDQNGLVALPNGKRRKVSHGQSSGDTVIPDAPPSLGQDLDAPVPSAVPYTLIEQQTSERTRVCVTPDCSNVLANVASLGTGRCSTCVIRDWKSRKSRAIEQARVNKTVSWADGFRDSQEREEAIGNDVEMGDANDAIVKPESSSKDEKQLSLPLSSTSVPTEDESRKYVSVNSPVPKPTGLKIKLNLSSLRAIKPISSGWDSSDPDSISDSSLSDMDSSSDEEDASSDTGSTSSEDIPLAQGLKHRMQCTGFTIRIPSAAERSRKLMLRQPASIPHPEYVAGVLANGGRWCINSSRCRQVLRREYQWKSCVLCRAKTRQYQRKRQNIQGSHKHLDEELELYKSAATAMSITISASASRSRSSSAQGQPSSAPGPQVDELSGSSALEPVDPSRIVENEQPRLIAGARLCSVKRCPRILPPEEEYGRRMCFKCRKRWKIARLRKKHQRAGTTFEESNAEDLKEALTCLEDPKQREDSRCLSIDCGMLIDSQSSYGYCHQCRLRATRVLKKQLKREGKNDNDFLLLMRRIDTRRARRQLGIPTDDRSAMLSVRISAMKLKQSKHKPRPPAPYPEYKGLTALLDNFGKLTRDFFKAQIYHYALDSKAVLKWNDPAPKSSEPTAKSNEPDPNSSDPTPAPKSNEPEPNSSNPASAASEPETSSSDPAPESSEPGPNSSEATNEGSEVTTKAVEPIELPPTIFCFDGEFTTVAPDFDVVSRKAAIDAMVTRIKQETEEAANLKFGPKRWVSLFDYGMATRFICGRECRLALPPRTPGGAPEERVKLMQGELEVVVLMDRTHPYFPGERTVVRLRLIG